MATKAERTIVVSDAIYMKIYRLAEKEQTNIPFVVRQLLVKGLADERNRPDWFYEMQREVVGLRNDVLAAQRKNEEQDLTEEQLLQGLKKQITELTRMMKLKEALAVKPETLVKLELEEEDDWHRREIRQMLWGKSPEIDAEESEERELVDRPTTAAYLLWGKSPELEAEPMKEPEQEPAQEPVEEVASILPAAKGKVIRPFFGRLSQMFSSVLS